MTVVALLALAFLSGVSAGVILGIAICYVSFARQEDDDPDYSGGF